VTPSLAARSGDRWVVFAIAWPVERAARMTASAERVRAWLVADGVSGVGMGKADREAVRQRGMADGLKPQESWLVDGVLMADARRLTGPGARVRERVAQMGVGGPQSDSGGLGGSGDQIPGADAAVGRTGPGIGLLEVERYAVVEHGWEADDRAVVVEDIPWSRVADGRESIWAWPVSFWGVAGDPWAVGLTGKQWTRVMWRRGGEKPEWVHWSGAQGRVFAVTRPYGWAGMPLQAGLDDVEPYMAKGSGDIHTAWLVPGGSGSWALSWQV
jgi:hypothetical protein